MWQNKFKKSFCSKIAVHAWDRLGKMSHVLEQLPFPWSLQEPETLSDEREGLYGSDIVTYNRATEALFPYKTPLLEQ